MSVVARPGSTLTSGLGTWLRSIPLARIVQMYRLPAGPSGDRREDQDAGRGQRLASVVSSYHAQAAGGRPLVIGWCRPDPTGPVTVLVSGATNDATGREPVPVRFPPGAYGHRLAAEDAGALLVQFPVWTRLTGVVDGVLLDKEAPPEPQDRLRPAIEDCLLEAWHEAFAWLLVAEPMPVEEVRAEAARVAALERDARTRTSSPEYVIRAERLARRHRELRAGESTGLWRVHLLAGGADQDSAAAVAGLLVASADLTGLPYALAPSGDYGSLDTVLQSRAGSVSESDSGMSPFIAGSSLVAAIARPPAVEIPGVWQVLRPTFDVTPEASTVDRKGIAFGQALDRSRKPAGTLRLPLDSLNRHTFVAGATGAGKSQTIRNILEQATREGVPWLVIEPAKAEYRRVTARVPDSEVVVLRPGDPDAPPVGINPLEPAGGFPLQTHADLVRALFIAAFEADEPFPQILASALTKSYERQGWDLTLGESRNREVEPRYPTLADLQATATQVVEEIGYSKEITDNVRGFISVRLGSLRLGTTGRFFEGGHPLDVDTLLTRNVVIEIEDVGDDLDKAFLMGAVLIRLAETLRVRDRTKPHSGGLRHITVIEEAHRLLRKTEASGPAAHAVEMFASLLAEVRAYGEGILIAEQIPAKLIPDAIKNTAVKVIHRLPAQDDRESIGATMNLTDEQSRYLVTLPPGTSAVFTDGMDHPILVKVPDGTAREQAPPEPASPALLVQGRAPGCGSECGARACTLRDMTAAKRALGGELQIVAWAELSAVAHLVGLTPPTPRAALGTALGKLDARLIECAIRHAAGSAVTSRSAALAEAHSSALFIEHLAAEMRALLAGMPGCTARPRAWLAPQFTWNLIQLDLYRLLRDNPAAGRHPDSDRWEEEYGRAIPGTTARDQLDVIAQWSRRLQRDTTMVDTVLFGQPSPLQQRFGVSPEDAGWEEMLAEQMNAFDTVAGWPRAFLVGLNPETSNG